MKYIKYVWLYLQNNELKNIKWVFKILANVLFFCANNVNCFSGSLGGLNWFGIKVAFSIHRGFFLSVRGVAGIHVVGWDGPCYGAEAGHGDLEELCIKFLGFR